MAGDNLINKTKNEYIKVILEGRNKFYQMNKLIKKKLREIYNQEGQYKFKIKNTLQGKKFKSLMQSRKEIYNAYSALHAMNKIKFNGVLDKSSGDKNSRKSTVIKIGGNESISLKKLVEEYAREITSDDIEVNRQIKLLDSNGRSIREINITIKKKNGKYNVFFKTELDLSRKPDLEGDFKLPKEYTENDDFYFLNNVSSFTLDINDNEIEHEKKASFGVNVKGVRPNGLEEQCEIGGRGKFLIYEQILELFAIFCNEGTLSQNNEYKAALLNRAGTGVGKSSFAMLIALSHYLSNTGFIFACNTEELCEQFMKACNDFLPDNVIKKFNKDIGVKKTADNPNGDYEYNKIQKGKNQSAEQLSAVKYRDPQGVIGEQKYIITTHKDLYILFSQYILNADKDDLLEVIVDEEHTLEWRNKFNVFLQENKKNNISTEDKKVKASRLFTFLSATPRKDTLDITGKSKLVYDYAQKIQNHMMIRPTIEIPNYIEKVYERAKRGAENSGLHTYDNWIQKIVFNISSFAINTL